MNKRNLWVALVALSAVAGVARADDAAPTPLEPTTAATAWYLGAAAGRANYSGVTTAADSVTSVALDHKAAGKVFGGYQFNANVGAELGYVDLGRSNGIQGKGEYVDLVGTTPLAPGLDLVGKVGVASLKADGSSDTSYQSGANVGIGLAYHLNQNVALRGEVERFDKVGKDLKANVGTVGLQFGF